MATSNRGERLRFRYGICLNDGCSKAKAKEVQQIGARKDFICEECGKQLRECPPPTTTWQKYGKMIIAGAVALVAILAFVVWQNLPKANTEGENVTPPTEVVDTITKVTEQVDSDKSDKCTATEPVAKPVKVLNGRGTVDLGYGTYTGDLKNGKPHGHGVIKYKKATKIVNSKDFIANPGDTFDGDFRDGKISGLGYWKHDGNETAVKP